MAKDTFLEDVSDIQDTDLHNDRDLRRSYAMLAGLLAEYCDKNLVAAKMQRAGRSVKQGPDLLSYKRKIIITCREVLNDA